METLLILCFEETSKKFEHEKYKVLLEDVK